MDVYYFSTSMSNGLKGTLHRGMQGILQKRKKAPEVCGTYMMGPLTCALGTSGSVTKEWLFLHIFTTTTEVCQR